MVCVSNVRSQGKKEEVPCQYVLRKTKGEEHPMTMTVKQSITLKTDDRQKKTIEKPIRADFLASSASGLF